MSKAEINNELMVLSQYYGSIVATSGVDEEIVKKCNKQLKRCIDALDEGLDNLLAAKAGIITEK